ncbi:MULTISPECIES: 5-dehydro-4-deoxy-D-glucuronate isomerase [Streptococcus]|uniref:4-deoxy-L-threo-5-hexosulose-uronate ketol-isomerase n=3 Tax=Streptococcus parauberis TaxID=1348 RepID=F1YXP2_9STRE|nr:5-dehydro-4-deoxy-D-glucuronate isomerase [Streptococcus parauberis]AUT05011.1 5-dehydro-4-deoxy-D-glucuronate isomerase [Streptococcus parauberis]EGE53993.1 4-deoxy-L-threo-5-hexosulose-uronate ketol-isomerase [Streptococcus parauberis NCFD 2020]EMF48529.1 4-deoxy-L-threo-5-hexosulose-uronate ketol-isomerase [Streptococcus parauberis KRS-02109]EMG25103.1 4-deoxy-L-threo-5-hexosulose-uronate ketol-isomerase [Streptococcus parauberis KRS-02083]KYP17988.1 4-deoxy-L-threo-5-hexosulose-uronate 
MRQQTFETRYTHAPNDIEHFSTEELRNEFVIESIFEPGWIHLTYTHNDRLIFGGVEPLDEPLEIVLDKVLGVDYFLQRRELGFINIGGDGSVIIDGVEDEVLHRDGYYVGKETKEVIFKSKDPKNPAKFYVASAPAHQKYPSKKIALANIIPLTPGDDEHMNKRKINQYVHPNQVESCQLQMGLTSLAKGSSWNTMPCHTHERRAEVYMYFELPEEDAVFHMMGKPNATKHVVLHNEQGAISPSWSIHAGVATSNYSFIWLMAGENITYDDMDIVPINELK